MELLRVRATNYKNSCDSIEIDLIAKEIGISKASRDEIQEVAEGLNVFTLVAIIGKNASGKTTALELLRDSYSVLGNFRLENRQYTYTGVYLELIFYERGYVYKYATILETDKKGLKGTVNFTQQHIYKKLYDRTKVQWIYEDFGFEEVRGFSELPKDISNVFFVLKKQEPKAIYLASDELNKGVYDLVFRLMESYKIPSTRLREVLQELDSNINCLERVNGIRYRLVYRGVEKILTDIELYYTLSRGTTKGLLLYMYMEVALKQGYCLLVDDIETHLATTLVERAISEFTNRSINTKKGTLILTTHNYGLLYLFQRQDNILDAEAGVQCNSKVIM